MKLSLSAAAGGSSVTTTPVRGNGATTPGSSSGSQTIAESTIGGNGNNGDTGRTGKEICPLIATKYVEWCWDRFARPTVPGHSHSLGFNFTMPPAHMMDTQDPAHHTREWRYGLPSTDASNFGFREGFWKLVTSFNRENSCNLILKLNY